MTVPPRLRQFFFRPVNASGWGLMRIAWALTTLVYLLGQWQDVARYYSDAGLLPPAIEPLYVRSQYIFSILFSIGNPTAVFFLYLILLLSCLCMALGQWPRLMTIVSVLLLFSFHERDPLPLGGGDTVLRLIGFLLILSPGTVALSLPRLDRQWQQWKKNRRLLPPPTMPAWPQVLLQWQIIVLYVTSAWDKLNGTMWLAGTAPAIALQHPHFARFPGMIENALSYASPTIAYATLVFELSWLLLLLPPVLGMHLPGFHSGKLRRWLLLAGVVFHGAIFLFLDAGSFSPAMLTAYLGLLRDEDFAAMKAFWNKRWLRRTRKTHGQIDVLYDGRCGFCTRSVFWLALIDWLGRLRFVNFHNAVARAAVAPELPFAQLNRSMHIKMPDGRTFTGFRAFRVIAHHLPLLWPLVPVSYLPGATAIGDRTYQRIADKRKTCDHEDCGF